MLIEAKRYDDAAQARPFARMTGDFDRNVQYLATVASQPNSEAIKTAHTKYIVSTAAKNIEVLAGAGDLPHARELTAKLLAFDASEATKALLQTDLTRAGHAELLTPPPAK